MHLYGFLKEWRKRPHWSFSCCLAFIIPLISLPADFSGFIGTNVINNQLETGDIELPTIAGAVQDSGAIDVTLEKGEEGDVDPPEAQDDSCHEDQPQTGEEGVQSEAASVQDSKTVEVATEEGKQSAGNPAEMQDDNRTVTPPKNEGKEKSTCVTALQYGASIDVALEGEQGDGNSAKVHDDGGASVQSQSKGKDTLTSDVALEHKGAADVTLEGESNRGDANPSAEMQSKNRADTQPKNDRKEIPINGSALLDSGAHEGGQVVEDYPKNVQYGNCQDADHNANRRHQGVQTELSTTVSIVDIVELEPVKKAS